jgi:hypothetical protein
MARLDTNPIIPVTLPSASTGTMTAAAPASSSEVPNARTASAAAKERAAAIEMRTKSSNFEGLSSI